MIKKIVEILPILSLILLINAIFNQILYYYCWGINILNFISFDELFVLFFKDFILLSIFVFVFFIHAIVLTVLDGGYSEVKIAVVGGDKNGMVILFKRFLNNSGKNIAAFCLVDIVSSISTLGFFSNLYIKSYTDIQHYIKHWYCFV